MRKFFGQVNGTLTDSMANTMRRRLEFFKAACRRYILELEFPEDEFPGAEELLSRTKILKSRYDEIHARLLLCQGEFLMKFPEYNDGVLHFKLYHEEIRTESS